MVGSLALSVETDPGIADVFEDFLLSRQAMLCTHGTMRFYRNTAGKFVEWLEDRQICSPEEIAPRHVRSYLYELARRGLSDSTIHGHARAIRTFTYYLHTEGYVSERITFRMPKVAKKRLPVLTPEELDRVVQARSWLIFPRISYRQPRTIDP